MELFEGDDKSTPIIRLRELNLNDEQKDLISMLINIFGDGIHPFADNDSIDKFSVSYLKEILVNSTLIKGKIKQTKEVLIILKSVEEILKKY